MKKIFLAVMMFAVILMNGCGTDDGTIKVGAVKYLNVMEDSLDEMLSKKSSLPPGSRKHVFFENLSTMLAALMAGQIDEISVYRTVAVHLSNTNPDVDWLISEPVVSDVFCCAMREEDVELKREFDAAILQLSKDGTLSKLVKNYIDESNRNDEPPAIELPTFYGAETVRIGVTGDLPLLDYIRPDGMPAGFNTAVLEWCPRNGVVLQRSRRDFLGSHATK